MDLGGNKVPTYNNDVTLTVNGSATIVGGNSLVDIINGEGTLNVTDTHAETVVLGHPTAKLQDWMSQALRILFFSSSGE